MHTVPEGCSSPRADEQTKLMRQQPHENGTKPAILSEASALLAAMRHWEEQLAQRQLPIDKRDQNTPDDWVPRHQAMVRLTGRHPFNAEPPLCLLDQDLTSQELHYVRNHGAVPHLTLGTHRIHISGLVERPGAFSVEELLALGELVTIPVTLVCAGNRRKELNQIRQSIGFHWGAGGASTSFWTGVRLADVLRHCQVCESPKARYVCFTGADEPAKGPYGTSIPLAMALDPHADVLLAVAQNGAPLHPDHGYPVRLLVPGWIGGRMVKWLSHVEVSDRESQNHYHFFDNRIMPPHVDKERADSEKWWYRPEYLFNELNINSAVVRPLHDELLPLHHASEQHSYRIEGYAYSGGGRPVTRVEITFDDGQLWNLCELRHPFEPNAAGRQWAWSRFSFNASLVHLLCCTEFAVRAWDSSNNTQPHRWTWNVMGMGNNAWYRVRVSPVPDPGTGRISLRFEHPTVPGPTAGGWMGSSTVPGASHSGQQPAVPAPATEHALRDAPEAKRDTAQMAERVQMPPVPNAVGSTVHGSNVYQQMMRKKTAEKLLQAQQRLYTIAQVERHQSETDLWIVVRGRVYDVTRYLNEHPGGKAAIMMNAGQDCTEDFEAIHSEKAWKLLDDFYIGELAPAGSSADASLSSSPHLAYTDSSTDLLREPFSRDAVIHADAADGACTESIDGCRPALDPKKWKDFVLASKSYITKNTVRLRFALPDVNQVLGLPTGNHLLIRARIENKNVARAYTPTSLGHEAGFFELVIKVYRAGAHPSYPSGGKMSQYLELLRIGDTVQVKGPLGHFSYVGLGAYMLHGRAGRARRFAFLCAGSGITPAFQVMKAIQVELQEHAKQSSTPFLDAIYLVYANRNEDEILLFQELEAWRQCDARFQFCYVLSQPSEAISKTFPEAVVGHVNQELLAARLPGPRSDLIIGICGPAGFQDDACIPALKALGYSSEQFFTF